MNEVFYFKILYLYLLTVGFLATYIVWLKDYKQRVDQRLARGL
jgi:hypothetical protein